MRSFKYSLYNIFAMRICTECIFDSLLEQFFTFFQKMEPVVIKWPSGNFSNAVRSGDVILTVASSVFGTAEEKFCQTAKEAAVKVHIFGRGYSSCSSAVLSCEQPVRLRKALVSLLPSGTLDFSSNGSNEVTEVLNRLSSVLVLRGFHVKEDTSPRGFPVRKTSIKVGDSVKLLGLPFNNEWNKLFKMMLWKGR